MRNPTGPSRRSVLSDVLTRSLDRYALCAAAAGVGLLAAAQPSGAQIVYTPAHQGMGRNAKIQIDLNHDGVVDLVIREISAEIPPYPADELQSVPKHGTKIALGRATEYALNMAPASIIGNSRSFVSSPGLMILASTYGIYYYGSWAPEAIQRYLGIKFMIHGEAHYGWARLSARHDYRTRQIVAILTGYAYETQPNQPIRAGDSGGSEVPGGESENLPAPEPNEAGAATTLGALALGAPGIPLWRNGKSSPAQ
jgi:hypothetical protein